MSLDLFMCLWLAGVGAVAHMTNRLGWYVIALAWITALAYVATGATP